MLERQGVVPAKQCIAAKGLGRLSVNPGHNSVVRSATGQFVGWASGSRQRVVALWEW